MAEKSAESLTSVAGQRGWEVIEIYRDAGISGTRTRKDRPGLDRLLTDASRARFNVLMVWAIEVGSSVVQRIKRQLVATA